MKVLRNMSVLGLAAVMLLGGCQSGGSKSETVSSDSTAAEAATAQAAADEAAESVTFQILYTSDTHGSFDTYNYTTNKETVGGLTRIGTLVRQEKEAFDGKTFVVDAGDIIQGNGTSFFLNNQDYQPYPNIAAFNAIGYDVLIPGNHEFNFGINTMYEAIEGFNGVKLCANVTYEDGSLLNGFEPYHIFTLDEGVRVAMIGVTTPNIETWDSGNMEKDGTKAENAAAVTRRVLDELIDKDMADVYVLLAHMGTNDELGRDGSGAESVAAINPELAVILGAHNHAIMGTKDEQVVLEPGIKYVQNVNAAASLGKIQITVTKENGAWVLGDKTGSYEDSSVKTDVIAVTEDIPKDEDVLAVVSGADEAVYAYVNNTIVGTLAGGPLVPEPEIDGNWVCAMQDTALSDLINNAMLYTTGADISATAVMDRIANYQPGPINLAGMTQIYKYDNNTLYKLKMSGAQILSWMEWSYSYYGSTVDGKSDPAQPAVNLETDLTIPYGTMRDYFHDQFAGIIYEVDLTKPAGERINIVSMADGSEFDEAREYTAAINNYRATTQLLKNNEDGVFKPGEATAELLEPDVQTPNGNISMIDIITEYIQLHPDQTITNDCDNNWSFVNLDWDMELREKAIEAINNGQIETDFTVPVTKEQVLALD